MAESKMLKRSFPLIVMALAALLGACAGVSGGEAVTTPNPGGVERGEQIAASHCASCHAIAATGVSPHPLAPPLRTLGQQIDALDLAFTLGVHVGFSDMPTVRLERREYDDLIGYIHSIEAPR